MLIGIIGAPNKGKSTLFAALTMADVAIADYPFTTIKPNHGVAYVPRKCVEVELKVKCTPKNSACENGIRYIPVNVVDVAGLVPGAHLGKGMGNQFLNDAIAADVLIQVVDLTGKTDQNGNHCEYSNPADEVRMISDELAYWMKDIIKKHLSAISKRSDGANAIADALTGLRISADQITDAANRSNLTLSNVSWGDKEMESFSRNLLSMSKPIIVAANKMDVAKPDAFEKLKAELPEYRIVPCSAAVELALKKAERSKVIKYFQAERRFDVVGTADADQKRALEYMKGFIAKNGTGVAELLREAVFNIMRMIVVYPVEDENKYTDHFGNVLPDAILVREGSTAMDLAGIVHTDLAKHMLYAIDAKKKMRVNKEHVLKEDDVLRIVSAAK